MPKLQFAVVLSFLLTLAGAVSEPEPLPPLTCANVLCVEGNICVETDEGPQCIDQCTMMDCAQGYRCELGNCIDVNECTEIAWLVPPCDDGFHCYNLIGGTPGFACVPDCAAPCPSDQECGMQGECIDPEDGSCAAVSCPVGHGCEGGRCFDLCDVVSCGEGYTCREGQCADIDECSLQTIMPARDEFAPICEEGEYCVNEPGGFRCEEDMCIGQECRPGDVCDPATGLCGASCAAVLCPEGWYCSNGECRDTCEIIRIACPIGTECRDGGCKPVLDCSLIRCAEGFVCVDGQCVRDPCSRILCRRGYVCDAELGQCVDRDECLYEEETGFCGGKVCWNYDGGFACRPNYCASTLCIAEYTCVNTPWRGVCKPNFCATMECPRGWRCVDRPQRGICVPRRLNEADVDDWLEASPERKSLILDDAVVAEDEGGASTLVLATVLPACTIALLLGVYFKYRMAASAASKKCVEMPAFPVPVAAAVEPEAQAAGAPL